MFMTWMQSTLLTFFLRWNNSFLFVPDRKRHVWSLSAPHFFFINYYSRMLNVLSTIFVQQFISGKNIEHVCDNLVFLTRPTKIGTTKARALRIRKFPSMNEQRIKVSKRGFSVRVRNIWVDMLSIRLQNDQTELYVLPLKLCSSHFDTNQELRKKSAQ